MTPQQKQLYKAVDEILWNDWDPIGVNDMPEAAGEYVAYAEQVLGFKLNKASVQELADLLFRIETEMMGLQGNYEHCQKISEKILSL